MKVKLNEVADLAGVGLATVDRVLNERGGVAPATAKKVVDAARQLGWARLLPSIYRTGLRFEVFLGRRDVPLFAKLNNSFERLIPSMDRGVVIQRTFVDHTRPDRVAKAIVKTRGNAIVVYGQEDDAIIDAIATVTSGGVPVVTMISDVPTSPRLAYVGIDHYSAGRASAFLMSRMAADRGVFVALCHSFEYRAHSERISGFRDGVAEYCPAGRTVELIEGRDDQLLTKMLLAQTFQRHSDVAGIYDAGALNIAIEQTLRERNDPGIVFIGHDLVGDTARMLEGGVMTVAIDESPDVQAEKAINILLHRFGLIGKPLVSGMVPFQIHVRDSLFRKS